MVFWGSTNKNRQLGWRFQIRFSFWALGNRPSASVGRKAKKIKPKVGCVLNHASESTTPNAANKFQTDVQHFLSPIYNELAGLGSVMTTKTNLPRTVSGTCACATTNEALNGGTSSAGTSAAAKHTWPQT